jgi:hypothetical protein
MGNDHETTESICSIFYDYLLASLLASLCHSFLDIEHQADV